MQQYLIAFIVHNTEIDILMYEWPFEQLILIFINCDFFFLNTVLKYYSRPNSIRKKNNIQTDMDFLYEDCL